jgi:cytoskeletal protein RodZ
MELELGTLLKKAREEKGLSLDDIQEETKIRKKYLEAIEENNFDILPGKVYLKVLLNIQNYYHHQQIVKILDH